MLPNLNFNPNFGNLAALRNLGGVPHAAGPIGPISTPMSYTPPTPMPGPMPGMPGPLPGVPMSGPAPSYSGLPAPATAPMGGLPQGNLGNLRALMQLFGRQF